MSEQTNTDLVQATTDLIGFNSKDYIEAIKEKIINGSVEPLPAFVIIKRMSKVSEELLKDEEIKNIVIAEADKFIEGNKKSFSLYGANISKGAVYTYYDFSECNHEVLNELYRIKKDVESKIAVLEEELKLLILPDTAQMSLGIQNNTKEVVVERMPFLKWEECQDQITVQAPKKIQKTGLRFNKI